jgi:N utilization substance protein A
VQNVVQELQGERIDIVPWSPDPAKYVYNALAPAEVSMVIVDDDKKFLLVVVPDDQLSLAIGRQGQNVRLASRLLGWKIDVKSEQRYANMENNGYCSLTDVDGVDEGLADRLFAAGITSAGRLAGMETEQLMSLARLEQEKAKRLQQKAALIQPPEVAFAPPPLLAAEDGEQDEDGPDNAPSDVDSQSADPDLSEDPGKDPA